MSNIAIAGDDLPSYQMRNMINEVYNIIKSEYVEKIEEDKLKDGALSGMLNSLDLYSNYMTPKEFESFKDRARGEFGGIGIEIVYDNGLLVISPLDDTPAYYAGIKSGDLIVSVNNEPVVKMTANEAIKKISGPKGTKVKLTILRDNVDAPIEMEITRDIIKFRTIKHYLDQDVAYLRINSFTANTASDLAQAIFSIKKERNKDFKGYVIDLRNNPGGLLEQAILVSEIFLDGGKIVSTKGRNSKDNVEYVAHAGRLVDEPLVVLINGGSASASEIVSGAIQDNKRGIIMGTKSFGKASVQSVIPLSNKGAISMTTALYYTPSGKLIQDEGIIPDIKIEYKIENDKKNQKQSKKIKYTEKNNRISKDRWVAMLGLDNQLQSALRLLRSENVTLGRVK